MKSSRFLATTFYLICLIFILKLVTLFIYPLHHPSEVRYASIAMRMALTQNYLMPFFDPITPFFGKPPLSFWASAVSIELFGFNEFAARFPHYLALIATCLILYRSIKEIFDRETALISVAVLSSSILFYALHSVMTEAFLLLGMTMILVSFLPIMRGQQNYGFVFFLGCTIAMLTKGPVGIIMPCLAMPIYLSITHEWKKFFKNFPFVFGGIFFIITTLPWFFLAEKSYPGFLQYFLVGENLSRFAKSGWKGDLYGNAHHVKFATIWLFFIFSTLPAVSIFFLKPKRVFADLKHEIKGDKSFLFFALSFIAPMLFLTFMRNMIITYAIYAFIPFAIITGRVLSQLKYEKFVYFILNLTVVLYLIVIAAFLAKPPYLMEKINHQARLLSHIEEKDFDLYCLGNCDAIFTLYWKTHDQVEVIKEHQFNDLDKLLLQKISTKPVYTVIDGDMYEKIPSEYQARFKQINCTIRRNTCLYAVTTN